MLNPNHAIATFGAGCFWCTEAVFTELKGVASVVCGYSGGSVAGPTYEQVCGGRTGHAEVVRIEFDSDVISYEDLLQVFFQTHDPTTLNRQGEDVGTQYRSVVFFHNEQQRQAAETTIDGLHDTGAFDAPIVTLVEPAGTFFRAEKFHQDYYAANQSQPYCAAVIRPKLDKFQIKYRELMKDP